MKKYFAIVPYSKEKHMQICYYTFQEKKRYQKYMEYCRLWGNKKKVIKQEVESSYEKRIIKKIIMF